MQHLGRKGNILQEISTSYEWFYRLLSELKLTHWYFWTLWDPAFHLKCSSVGLDLPCRNFHQFSRLSKVRIQFAPELVCHHYHSLQTWLSVHGVPTSRQALLMLLESVPDPSEQRSVLRTLRSPTCKEEKQCLPVSAWSHRLPPQLYFPWQSVGCAGPVSSLDRVQAFNRPFNSLTFGLDPGVDPQLQPAAASGTDGWESGVESGCQFVLRRKKTSSQMRQTLRRREEGRTRTKGHKGSTTSGTKDVNQSWPEAGGPLNHHTALTQPANVNPLWAPLIFVSIPSSISRKSLTFGEICLLSFLLGARREDNLVGPVTRVIPAYWSIDWYKQEAVYLTWSTSCLWQQKQITQHKERRWVVGSSGSGWPVFTFIVGSWQLVVNYTRSKGGSLNLKRDLLLHRTR